MFYIFKNHNRCLSLGFSNAKQCHCDAISSFFTRWTSQGILQSNGKIFHPTPPPEPSYWFLNFMALFSSLLFFYLDPPLTGFSWFLNSANWHSSFYKGFLSSFFRFFRCLIAFFTEKSKSLFGKPQYFWAVNWALEEITLACDLLFLWILFGSLLSILFRFLLPRSRCFQLALQSFKVRICQVWEKGFFSHQFKFILNGFLLLRLNPPPFCKASIRFRIA